MDIQLLDKLLSQIAEIENNNYKKKENSFISKDELKKLDSIVYEKAVIPNYRPTDTYRCSCGNKMSVFALMREHKAAEFYAECSKCNYNVKIK
jgi:DNA-directed RNA polymerase subunit M/transcription elongation factor TFIIS